MGVSAFFLRVLEKYSYVLSLSYAVFIFWSRITSLLLVKCFFLPSNCQIVCHHSSFISIFANPYFRLITIPYFWLWLLNPFGMWFVLKFLHYWVLKNETASIYLLHVLCCFPFYFTTPFNLNNLIPTTSTWVLNSLGHNYLVTQ